MPEPPISPADDPAQGSAEESPISAVPDIFRAVMRAQVLAMLRDGLFAPKTAGSAALKRGIDEIVALIWAAGQSAADMKIQLFSDEELAAEMQRRAIAREGS